MIVIHNNSFVNLIGTILDITNCIDHIGAVNIRLLELEIIVTWSSIHWLIFYKKNFIQYIFRNLLSNSHHYQITISSFLQLFPRFFSLI